MKHSGKAFVHCFAVLVIIFSVTGEAGKAKDVWNSVEDWVVNKAHKYHNNPFWNDLRTTWNYNQSAPYHFSPTGRTVQAAENIGFQFRDNFCTSNNTKFRGYRYWMPNDPGIALLFDKNGIIAGIQTMIPKSKYTPPDRLINRPLVDDGQFWTMTAYFVNIHTICHGGRKKENLAAQGTGDRLTFQSCGDAVHTHHCKFRGGDHGALPATPFVKVPLTEKALNDSKVWKRGSCIRGMGVHYFYNISEDMKVDEYWRIHLLVFDGKLIGFFYVVTAKPLMESARYEPLFVQATKKAHYPNVVRFFDTDPDLVTVNTLHVYFVENAASHVVC